MKNLLFVFTLFIFHKIVSQEIVNLKEVYIENNLAYKTENNKLFTGIAQNKRKNGHLVYEEEYVNGVISLSNLYFNGKEIRVANKTIYNPNKPFITSKEIKYHLDGDIFETTTYNNSGIKILVEQFEDGIRTYSCQYDGKKKNGLEITYGKNGLEIICQNEYKKGKRIK